MKKLKISIVGAGNVGTQLALAFHAAGHQIHQIVSRRTSQSGRLAARVRAEAVKETGQLNSDADVYILCIPDQAIRDIKEQWSIKQRCVCHTSGSTEMQVLEGFSGSYGVFYPLQTFSTRKNVNFSRVPICIEANGPGCQELLYGLAKGISGDVRIIDSSRRLAIHLAAVIASNFSNYMYVLAEEILQKHGHSFSILHPLIEETSSKAVKISPYHAQTGPARRKDHDIIRKHLGLLASRPETQEIYDLITRDIIKKFQ